MAIAPFAANYLLSDMLVKDTDKKNKQRNVSVNLSVDQMITVIAVGLPVLLITLAFAQEVTVGAQISCFPPRTSFSWPQTIYINGYCWAAIQRQNTNGLPLWLHKFFPYFLLLAAILVYLPALFWRLSATKILSPDLSFIMNELDQSYNREIKLVKSVNTHTSNEKSKLDNDQRSLEKQIEHLSNFPLVKSYLETKRSSKGLLVQYLLCRLLTLVVLFLTCLYLYYYIRLSATDEFRCDVRSGVLLNDSSVPEAVQCKLVAVGVFCLLCYVNLIVYVLLAPVCVYAMLVPIRSSAQFLKPYEMLKSHEDLNFGSRKWDDLAIYLLFLQENLNQLKSYKCLKVLEVLQNNSAYKDIQDLLWVLAITKGEEMDGKKKEQQNTDDKMTNPKNEINQQNSSEKKDGVPLLAMESYEIFEENAVRHRAV